jgi:hypothetical protein
MRRRTRATSATRSTGTSTRLAAALAILLVGCSPAPAPDADAGGHAVDPAAETAALRALLDDFLANADVDSAHERFWAEDLVYTSSTGTRRGKAEIMAGFAGAPDPSADLEPAPTYSAADVDIRVYGTTAVVAFRLVIEPPEDVDGPVRSNFNTGTFLKRDGEWRVVAWQSTVIPE